jgi:hypothetical protein
VNLDHRLTNARWLLIFVGGVAAGLILAFSVVGSPNFDAGSMGAGQDARAYWRAVRVTTYGAEAGEYGAYLYSPAFLHVLGPILNLPWQQFLTVWTAALMATLLLLTGPVLFVFALPLAFFEIWGGNIHLLLAAAIVIGFRWPAAWSFVLLTKVTPGIGLLWFAVRREWRSLVMALGATLAIVVGSWLIDPRLWQAWIELLLREAGTPPPPGSVGIPLVVRLPIAALIVVYAALRNQRWLVPVGAMVGLPVLWWGSLSMLLGSVALERGRIEAAVVRAIGGIPDWIRARAERRTDWVAEPES